MAYTAVNPHNGETIQTFATATDEQISHILDQRKDIIIRRKKSR